ncbi:MAG TPA: KTSC domain-containing protein [Xanthobacteraceae bacterium]|jgi:hypothetical protein|nr:KTSC domain-containing protein [Xanthobacteraceae bacterium]
MVYVLSSVIRQIEYDEANYEITVRFTNGKTYTFFGVAPEVYHRFVRAPSKGQFFNMHVRDCYGCREVHRPDSRSA